MAKFTRRSFIQHASSTAAVTIAASPWLVRADQKNSALQFAAGGAGGKGYVDLIESSRCNNVQVVAMCDIDNGRLQGTHRKFPNSKMYTDWREMLDKENIDAMNVSTPDHSHAPIAISAMNKGIHVYGQKPISHTVHEARVMTKLAAEKGLQTQMGIQHHNGLYLKLGVAVYRMGVIGKVKKVYTWTDRPIWPQGIGRPDRNDPIPAGLDWDQWIGVAPMRPYAQGVYHPFKWRGWQDFGTGALGDMGCHIMDPVLTCLNLGAPNWIKSVGVPPNGETFPAASEIHYNFPKNEHAAGDSIDMIWYDGGKMPPAEVCQFGDFKVPKNGIILVGETGNLFISYDGRPRFSEFEKFKAFKLPKVQAKNHYAEWVDACHGKGKTSTPFSYSGPLTETVLLGNIALHFPGKQLNWDTSKLKFKNMPAADKLVSKPYRKGWEVAGIGQRV